MNSLRVFFAVAFSSLLAGPHQGASTLTRARCDQRLSGDSAATIRVSLEPATARSPALSLVLHRIRPNGTDSFFVQPPFGVDSIAHVPPGLYRLTVRLIGYYPPRDTVRVDRGDVWCITAHMVRDTIVLKPIY